MNKAVVIRPSSTLLWITILTGPVAFAINMQARFALVQWACGNHRDWVLPTIAITAFVATLVSTVVAWLAFTRFDETLERPRFMAMSGFILSAIFTLTIVANELPHLFLRSCD